MRMGEVDALRASPILLLHNKPSAIGRLHPREEARRSPRGIDLRKKGLRMREILIADNTMKISENKKMRKERSLPGTRLMIHTERRKAHLQ